jgi:anti-anti-sigma regulatory factor
MGSSRLEVRTDHDGAVFIRPHGVMGVDHAVELRRVLVHTVRRLRPLRLVLDLADVPEIDAINVGTLSAVCGLGDDHHVLVFLDNSTAGIAERLAAAGVPAPRLRRTATPV